MMLILQIKHAATSMAYALFDISLASAIAAFSIHLNIS